MLEKPAGVLGAGKVAARYYNALFPFRLLEEKRVDRELDIEDAVHDAEAVARDHADWHRAAE